MQRAGVIKGKAGNQFDPQAGATRAEVSALLHRFVEVIIDPATAQGWRQNDSGQWLSLIHIFKGTDSRDLGEQSSL